jgi:tetratricopeptide (TPR) repeat protein
LLLRIATPINGLADAIAHLCGYLPLALRNSAALLTERPDMRVEDFVQRLTDAQHRLEPVAGSIGLSYELLDDELQRLWRSLSVFPGMFDFGGALSVWAIEKDAAQDALSKLVKYNLVEWHEVAERYRLHDLVRLFADKRLTEAEREEPQRRHAGYYITVLKAADHLFDKGGENRWVGLALLDTEWHNIQAGQSWSASNTDKDKVAATLCSLYPDAGAHLLHLRVHPTLCIQWREAAVVAARKLGNRTEEAYHLGNLGTDYAELGRTRRAIKCHEQALQISREISKRDSEAHDLSNLGTCYISLGEPTKAIEYLEQSLLAYREIGDHHGEGLTLGNLGMLYAELGQSRKAIKYYEAALPLIRESGDRRNEGGLLSSLGARYAHQGETERAVELYQTALSISYEVGDLRGAASNLGKLGWILASTGDDRRGFELHKEQLSAARKLGDIHNEADAFHGLAVIYSKYRDDQRAVECFERALKIFEETGHRYSAARALGDLGNHYTRAERFDAAIECYERQLVIARETQDRRGEALAIWNTAWALSGMGNRAEAVAKGEEALKILEEIEDWNQIIKLRKHLDGWRNDSES